MPADKQPMATWQLDVGFLTDVGLHRERNEDAYHVFLPYAGEENEAPVDAVFAVADGMGGHEGGDVAGQFVAEAVQRELAYPGAPSPDDLPTWLRSFMQRVNGQLCAVAANATARGMGSTLTMAVLRDGQIHLGHVGDSRCYRLGESRLEQMTQDHSWVAQQVRAGLLTEEEAEGHPDRNLLTQCLGVGEDLETFASSEPLEDGGRYLLCSDGLHGLVGDPIIERILREESDPQAAAARLVGLALEAGGHDNVTVLVFDAREDSALRKTMPGLEATTLPGIQVSGAPVPDLATAPIGQHRRPGLRDLSPAGMVMAAGLCLVVLSAGIGGWLTLRASDAPGASPVESTETAAQLADSAIAAPAGMVTDTQRLDAAATLPEEPTPAVLSDSLLSILEPNG